MTNPPTIHDVGGFPRELFEVQYPASGDATLVRYVFPEAGVAVAFPVGGVDGGSISMLSVQFG